ncbi:hypothetical protein [Nocardia sp. NPDC057440]|uniref:hypothetical protein n=1 Tax=Nocardia sp. NPDC057440 TaxID=3346134 RepID=UPI00366B469F
MLPIPAEPLSVLTRKLSDYRVLPTNVGQPYSEAAFDPTDSEIVNRISALHVSPTAYNTAACPFESIDLHGQPRSDYARAPDD